jgi:2-dehydro-3-deoxygalactonokinase
VIGVDWGTTSLRAFHLSGQGALLEVRSLPLGLRVVAGGQGFAAAFAEICAGWDPTLPVLLCGMVGSRRGWREAPYLELPASPPQAAASLTPLHVSGRRAGIIPGLRGEGLTGDPEFVRGEETLAWGAIEEGSSEKRLLCLPGTHSKWLRVQGQRIEGIQTFLTGELYGLLARHSILAEGWVHGKRDLDSFLRGVGRAREASLLGSLFSVRSLGLSGSLSPAEQASYLSGLLIGAELADRRPTPDQEVTLVGDSALTEAYADALAAWEVPTRQICAERAASRGLWAIARNAGWVEACQ